jgi:ADP-ribose pyrophosphatase YjhB (NUDIX family)
MNDRLFPLARSSRSRRRCFDKAGCSSCSAREVPLLGDFSLPGVVVEVGETLAYVVARELMEAVSVEAEIIAFNRHVEAIVTKGTEYGRILSSLRSSPDG